MLIKLENVSKKFDTLLLENQSITLEINGVVCLIGESGVGKTTLSKMILKNDSNYEGNISYHSNEEIIGAIMPQSENLIENFSVYENLNIFTEDDEKIISILNKLEIADLKNQKVCKISGGQRQRVNFARTLIQNPNFVILDEPTSKLDEDTSLEILKLINNLSEEINFLIISHDHVVRNYFTKHIEIKAKNIATNFDVTESYSDKKIKFKSKFFRTKFINQLFKNYKKVMFQNILISSFLLALSFISISYFLNQKNLFYDTVYSFYDGKDGGVIKAIHEINHPKGECEKFIVGELCGEGELDIPGYLTFSQEEIDYLNDYEGFENSVFSYDIYGMGNFQNFYDGNRIDITKSIQLIENFNKEYPESEVLWQEVVPNVLIDDVYKIQKYGTMGSVGEIFDPLYGEVRNIDSNEMIISSQLAEVIASELDTTSEDLVGKKIKVPSCRVDTEICDLTTEYEIAWIYKSIENSEITDEIYIGKYDPLKYAVNYFEYIPGNQGLIYKYKNIEEKSDITLNSYSENYKSLKNSEEFIDNDSEAINKLIEDYSSLDNAIAAAQTGYVTFYYDLKDGYSQNDLKEYINNGPDVLKYRANDYAQKLLNDKSYNDTDITMIIICVIFIIVHILLYCIGMLFNKSFKSIFAILKSLLLKQEIIKSTVIDFLIKNYLMLLTVSIFIYILLLWILNILKVNFIIYPKDMITICILLIVSTIINIAVLKRRQ